MRNEIKLDAIDHEILLHLSQDGRMTNAELSKKVGLTPAPCLRRVQRLEREGVITGYRAVVDPRAQGRGFEVIVSVETTYKDSKSIHDFEDAVAKLPQVTEARRMMGLPDYFLRVNVADPFEYERFNFEVLSTLPGVSKIVSHQNMATFKTTI